MSKRIKWVDGAKGIAMLMVVTGHAILWSGLSIDGSCLIRFIEMMQMPLFMAISGYLLGGQELDGYQLLKKLRRLMIPFFSWTLLETTSNYLFRGFSFDLCRVLIRPDKALWFLWVLLAITLLVFVARSLSFQRRIVEVLLNVGFSIGLIGFVAIAKINTFGLNLIAQYYPFVVFGYLFRFFGEYIIKLPYKLIVSCTVIAVPLLIMGSEWWRFRTDITLPFGIVLSGLQAFVYRMSLSFIGVSLFLLWSIRLPDSRMLTNRIVINIGQNTLGIYGAHVAIHRILPASALVFFDSGAFNAVVLIIILLMASYGIIAVLRYWTFSKTLFLGE